MTNNASRKNFGQTLLEKKFLTPEQLEKAVQHQKKTGHPLSEALLALNFSDENQLLILLSDFLSVPPIKVTTLNIPEELLKLIPEDAANKYQVLPISKIGNVLTVAMSDPSNIVSLDDIEKLTKHKVNPVIGLRSEIRSTIEGRYRKSLADTVGKIIQDGDVASIELIKEKKEIVKDEEILRSVEDGPVIKLTNYILRRAVEDGASDILLEPLVHNARVRFRIDGVLREVELIPRKMLDFSVSRIKVMSNLNITEHRLPQDGRFRMRIVEKNIDFRVSILPSTLGEKVVLRVLDKSQGLLDIDGLGLSELATKRLKHDSTSSYGMILACGPTGSGKTTTLYSILSHIYDPEKNVITVEDPLEYQLQGINQVNVNTEVGLTFAAALRSILRQDPDIIMVGEIRDFETVDIAIKAALTGHLVLSTLHTTTSSGSVTRLINMGVEPFLLSSTIIGVLAQKLVRKLCPNCRTVDEIDDQFREKYKISKSAVIYKPGECKTCANQGYKGRIAIGEYLQLSPEIKQIINTNCNEQLIKQIAREKGMKTLREEAIMKAEAGLTSMPEVFRTTIEDTE
ncbi:MAG: Flp pilus assembly complex ATPase component [Candidatus Omnitrophica bacterium]|nr:Flp pilus assembly complex ATPase component [Candidatus Omnitrophota bacterium]